MSHLSYLEKLLDGEIVEWVALGDVTLIKTGQAVSKQAISTNPGQYPVINSGREPLGFIDNWNTDNDPIGITTRGAGVGSITWQEGKYFRGNLNYSVTIKDSANLEVRYLYHLLHQMQSAIQSLCTFDGIPALNAGSLKGLEIPIPCPNNPEKSLAIQSEIVRILDAFTAMTAELTAELNMRKKQHSHYQFELLKFTETTQQLSIGECCDINKGATPIKKATPGKYPLVATTEERQSSSEYQFDCPAVCVPLISSRGHGVASIDRIYYQDGKFALGNILCAITPKDSEVLSAKFLRYYLFDKKDVLLVPLMRGGANVSLTMDSLKKVKIPIPPIADQQRIVRALDKFDEFVKALPREIELRQKQYEYYRDLLLSFPKSYSDEAA